MNKDLYNITLEALNKWDNRLHLATSIPQAQESDADIRSDVNEAVNAFLEQRNKATA